MNYFDILLAKKLAGGGDNPPVLIDKTITENGTYNAVDDQADGYRSVTVEVDPTPPEPPADGKTRLYITLAEGRLSPVLGLGVNGSVDVDWGDGTAHGTLTGSSTSTLVTIPHTYTQGGDYAITLTAAEGTTMAVNGTYQGSFLLTKGGTAGNESRVYLSALKKVHLGDRVTSMGIYAFNACYNLASVTISDSVTSIGNGAFYSCYGLTSVVIPDSVRSIGNYAFNPCYSLVSIVIPDSVTSIGSSAFQNCYGLTSVVIPDSVTSIGDVAFNSCFSLAGVTIPDSVISIGDSAFRFCYGLSFIKFESITPPVAGGSVTFDSIPTDCIIYVPEGTLEDYTSATNYPDDSVYTYVEY